MGIFIAVLMAVQLIFMILACVYFLNGFKGQSNIVKTSAVIDSSKETEKIKAMRKISLTMPLSETTRPSSMCEIIGQEEGIKALRAVFWG